MRVLRGALAAVAVALLLSGSAVAQDPGNLIVVYFTPDYHAPCGMGGLGADLTAYIMAINVSEPSGISGWECSLVTDPGTFLLGPVYTIANGGVNALTAPNFDVALVPAVPRAPIIQLATWRIFYLGGVIKLGLGPAQPGHFSSNPGPGYAAGDDPSRRTRLHLECAINLAPQPDTYYVAIWGEGCPVIGDEWPCVVSADQSSWGGIKQLYH